MTIFLPTLKQLHYLVALQDHAHFGKAADACFVTQSTLSAGIRHLTRRITREYPQQFLICIVSGWVLVAVDAGVRFASLRLFVS